MDALPTPDVTEQQTVQNKTIADLVDQQTEAIKKIISSQKQGHIEYPLVSNKEPIAKETLSADDLKVKCQHLLASTKRDRLDIVMDIKEKPTPPLKPEFNRFKPQVTVQSAGESGNQQPYNHQNNIKLIRYEPVILQKTILKDGQILYYWHKTLPYPQYLMVNKLVHNTGVEITTPATTTTTTTTTPKPSSTTPEPQYTEGLRFVVPVPYGNMDVTPKYPMEFDPYAYFPKYMQPQTVNMEVPYQPRFPVLKTIAIPSKYIQDNQ